MFKLKILNGPAKGNAYDLKSGENKIGRVEGNEIVLISNKVSKAHCVLVVSNGQVVLKDLGSSNGTFVNGALSKQKELKAGDKIAVGDIFLELREASEQKPAPVLQLHLPTQKPSFDMALQQPALSFPDTTEIPNSVAPAKAQSAPTNLKEKAKFLFEKYILNFLYNLNETQEWKVILAWLIGGLTVLASVLSVYPTMERVTEKLETEARERAALIAQQMVDRNTKALFDRQENKLEIDFAENAKGVTAAYLVDMEGRVLAPSRKLNQYLTDPNESSFSAIVRQSFGANEALERKSKVYGDVVAVAKPVRIFNPASGKNITVASGLIFYDRTQVLFDEGSQALAYIQALILAGIIGVLVFFSVYRLSLRPLNDFEDQVDQALKNPGYTVQKKFQMEEINSLRDTVNTALRRAQENSTDTLSSASGDQLPEETSSAVRFFSERVADLGIVLFDAQRCVLHMNPMMEELTGLRLDRLQGQALSVHARDEAFKALLEDSLSKAQLSPELVVEDFEFSGVAYKMECISMSSVDGKVKGFLLTAKKV